MAELKTKRNPGDVNRFLDSIESDQKRSDCQMLDQLMSQVTGASAEMWGSNIVGYGSYHYRYASGREGDWFLCGFAPRKKDLSVYIISGFTKYSEIMTRLGKHKTGTSCLYLRNLQDIDLDVLKELVEASVDYLRNEYGNS